MARPARKTDHPSTPLAAALRRGRARRKLTLAEVAARCAGVTPTAIWNYENARRVPSLDALAKLGRVYQVRYLTLVRYARSSKAARAR